MHDGALISRHIELNPEHASPANLRLVDSTVPVWTLAGRCQTLDGDIDQLAADFAVPDEVISAAIAYYRRYRAVINARLAANCHSPRPHP